MEFPFRLTDNFSHGVRPTYSISGKNTEFESTNLF